MFSKTPPHQRCFSFLSGLHSFFFAALQQTTFTFAYWVTMCETEGRARKQTHVLLKGLTVGQSLFPRQPSAVHLQSSRRWLAQQGSVLSGPSQTRSFSPPDSRGRSLSPPRPSHTHPWPGSHTETGRCFCLVYWPV